MTIRRALVHSSGTVREIAAGDELAQVVAPVTLSDAATVATDASLGTLFRVTLGGDRTLGNPTNMSDGCVYTWEVKQDATGGRGLSFASKWDFGDLPTFYPTPTAGATDVITARYHSSADKLRVLGYAGGY